MDYILVDTEDKWKVLDIKANKLIYCNKSDFLGIDNFYFSKQDPFKFYTFDSATRDSFYRLSYISVWDISFQYSLALELWKVVRGSSSSCFCFNELNWQKVENYYVFYNNLCSISIQSELFERFHKVAKFNSKANILDKPIRQGFYDERIILNCDTLKINEDKDYILKSGSNVNTLTIEKGVKSFSFEDTLSSSVDTVICYNPDILVSLLEGAGFLNITFIGIPYSLISLVIQKDLITSNITKVFFIADEMANSEVISDICSVLDEGIYLDNCVYARLSSVFGDFLSLITYGVVADVFREESTYIDVKLLKTYVDKALYGHLSILYTSKIGLECYKKYLYACRDKGMFDGFLKCMSLLANSGVVYDFNGLDLHLYHLDYIFKFPIRSNNVKRMQVLLDFIDGDASDFCISTKHNILSIGDYNFSFRKRDD